MTLPHLPQHVVFDNFLPARELDELIAFALGQEDALSPTGVQRSEGEARNDAVRSSWRASGAIESATKAFRAALRDRHEELLSALGIPRFTADGYETELVAHRDGDFYEAHIDTFTGALREAQSDRVISAVFYFHRRPKAFSGGQLALYPFGGREPVLDIEPECNRLAAFPSFAMHEVRTVRIPGNAFADARFAINCWIHRKRG